MENDRSARDYAAILADMEAKKLALETAIAGMRAALASGALGLPGDVSVPVTGISSTMQVGTLTAGATPVSLPRGAFLGKKLPEAIKLYLSAARKTQTNKEIAQALRDGGAKTKGSLDIRVGGTLFQLKKQGVVLRFDDGWGLAEWYPESFRNQASQDKSTGSKKRKTKAKTKAKIKVEKVGLDQKIMNIMTDSSEVDADAIAELLSVNKGAANLALGRLRAKRKLEKTPEGYRLPAGNVQQMPKAG
jgi:hypothetical protein